MGSGRQVAVFGAYGHTGRFVVAELLERGYVPVLSGRDADKLKAMGHEAGLDARVASADDPASLDRALAGTSAVINCAGPFASTTAPVIEAARDVVSPHTPAPTAADESGRSDQTFVIDAVVRSGDTERRAVARGQDIYAITAPLVVEALDRVLGGHIHAVGVASAGRMFFADDFLRALSPQIALELHQ
ncbi:NAD(P)H-binding protein [Kitasatospora sp. NBC_00085]|uniref:NAD(P)H-binding protein n=1 Tax=unclassified Kitasatospora TaxID=2633591 RepID=UPI0032466726